MSHIHLIVLFLVSLRQHAVVHQEKRFNCEYCGFQASRKGGLLSHVLGKHGPKHLTCELCGYKTGYPRHLRRHMKFCSKLLQQKNEGGQETEVKPVTCSKTNLSRIN